MPDELELFAAYMALPETNRSAFEALMAECMADADTRAVMTVLNVVLRETD
jgi:hypothetical protein